MAELLGEAAPGGSIGLSTRLDRAVSDRMRVEVVTEGLLVRRLQSDPALDGVAAVLFDEAHERNLDTDLALAFCLDMQRALGVKHARWAPPPVAYAPARRSRDALQCPPGAGRIRRHTLDVI